MGLTFQDVIFAAILAAVIAGILRILARTLTVIFTRSSELGYRPGEIEAVLQRCYYMFPIENLRFNGANFSRGMLVQVITDRNRTIEGEFIGANTDNMVCFLTPDTVIAQEIDSIEEIRLVGES